MVSSLKSNQYKAIGSQSAPEKKQIIEDTINKAISDKIKVGSTEDLLIKTLQNTRKSKLTIKEVRDELLKTSFTANEQKILSKLIMGQTFIQHNVAWQ